LEESPDIIRESSNSILSQIESKGIKCEWKEADVERSENTNLEQGNESEEIWSVFSVSESI
jgi:hypothetical protein